MVGFDDLKVSLSTYIMRNKRVTYQDLLKWSSSNKVGNALLYLLIREVVREKRFKVSGGEYVISNIKVGNGEVKLSIPMYIEVPGEGVKSSVQVKRQVRQRRVKSSSILEVFSEEKRAEVKQATAEGSERGEVKTTASEVKQEGGERQKEELGGVVEHKEVEGIHGSGKVETGIKEEKEESTGTGAEGVVIPTDYSTVAMEDFTAMLRRAIEEELPQNREEGYKVAMAMLSYLQRYWSVGELRLKLDIAKQFGGVNEGIMRIEDGVLRALRKLGIVEVMEPGVVNRIKELPRDFIKVRLDSLFT